MCYALREIEGVFGALREYDDANFLKPYGQSRNLNIYALSHPSSSFIETIISVFFRFGKMLMWLSLNIPWPNVGS